MSWQSSRKQLVWAGLLATLVGVLSGLSWVASAAPMQQATASPHLITPAEAEELIARFRATLPPGAVRAQFFYRGAFDALLAQPGAAGIRIYYGRYDDGALTFVLYATSTQGKDLPELAANVALPVPPFNAVLATEAVPSPRLASKEAPAMNSHLIDPEQAQESIARFRASAPPGAVLSYSLDRSALDELLAQPDAQGILIHYGKLADGTNTLVLHATDSLNRALTHMPMGRVTIDPPLEDGATRQ